MTTVTNKNGIEFDIDAIATDLNNKVDLDGTNATFPHIVSRTSNSQGGVVEIWSDGYCIQTGLTTLIADYGTYTTTLTQAYINNNYRIFIAPEIPSTGDDSAYNNAVVIRYATKTTNSFQIYNRGSINGGRYVNWRTEGYIR